MQNRIRSMITQRPITAAIAILMADIVLSVAFTLIARQLFSGNLAEFAPLFMIAAVTFLFVTILGWWQVAGFNAPPQWRHLAVLILPAIVIIVPPLVGGITINDPGNLLYLIIAYLLVGLREEALWRGVVLRILRPLGPGRSAIVGGVLFGLSHLANLVARGSPGVVIAQVIGSICDGIGFSVLRLRTNTIWFTVIFHALHDLLLKVTNLPAIPLDVVQVTILLLYGLYLIRRYPGLGVTGSEPAPAPSAARA